LHSVGTSVSVKLRCSFLDALGVEHLGYRWHDLGAKVASCWKRCCWCVHKTFSWWGSCLAQHKSGAHAA
jgi:hypothetical protein